MKSKMTTKHKAMAYVLNKDMGYTMNAIANLMNVAQSTVSKGIRDFEVERTMSNLIVELEQAKKDLYSLGYNQNPSTIVPPMMQQIVEIDTKYIDLE